MFNFLQTSSIIEVSYTSRGGAIKIILLNSTLEFGFPSMAFTFFSIDYKKFTNLYLNSSSEKFFWFFLTS